MTRWDANQDESQSQNPNDEADPLAAAASDGGSEPRWLQPSRLSNRDRLALALDGKRPTGDSDAHVAYQVAGRILSPHLRRLEDELRLQGPTLFNVVDGRYDHMGRVLISAGFVSNACSTSHVNPMGDSARPPVLLIGSDRRESTDIMLREHLQRGGLAVTSDRSADLATFAALGVRTRPGAATHVRAVRSVESSHEFMPRLGEDRLLPALRLSAGHRALLGVAQPHKAQVLLRHAETREPLVVLWQAHGGWVLHSVAHWWQNERPDQTLLGRWRLQRVPDFRTIACGEARWGEFQAGYCLLNCLLFAMRMSLTPQGVGERLREAA